MAGALEARIRKTLLSINDVLESPGTFDEDDAFWVNGTEIAHFHAGDLELRLTRPLISANLERLRADPRIKRRTPTSDWITIRCASARDVAIVQELADLAVSAHRPSPGAPDKPPPVGADLARRRRFH